MVRSLLLLLLPVSIGIGAALPAGAQVSELGLTGGVSYYIGDINPYRHYPRNTHLAGGLVYRYNFDQRYALRLQGLYTRLEAYDSDSPDSLQLLRNLGFRTVLFEASALLEINFFKYRGLTKDSRNWTPFVFAGLAYYHINPQNRLDDTWYDLQPLGTEGQGTSAGGDAYKLNQFCIPFGAGFKFAVTKKVDIQLEWGLRRTYTDYIDDVSGTYVSNATLVEEAGPLTALLADPSVLRGTEVNTGRARGDAQTRDWYQYTGLSITFLLTRFTECDAIWDRMKR
ncbi:MAG: hypothetical protein JST66_14925 [Bacteroidetes bacterium]|nr:hypothetical protein [Bacteroidota bacterium]